MALTDRRRHPRWEVAGLRAWLFVGESRPERCRIIDVSRKGVLVRSSRLLLPGMKVELAFARPYGARVTRLVRRWGEVARSTPRSFAVFFVNPPVRGGPRRRG